ncbi:AMP-binding enzyme domain protein [Aspergillus fischeri NRRL 181]|uniref:AMP-binding enzyme domain protein n=1 Tax=Neosartorya fischeri (strain ATCC 1020 / DSM 3700 / CBS 544.65 / FGSC A1164 / JCM 1740 / NRRL 181 / WB 181) TaxID=331117 RepID=A1D2U4_NEOFI|nr:AMP-binding enzyme domain protein [Aspergillus fischeri NRRL 181]EAW22737.1 AMP-binding enzyme domain protein [Aspergillus fischeri NRRL 181]KAG2022007.1 hypothetical protein GB937_004101 [Aspergillus fischeri]
MIFESKLPLPSVPKTDVFNYIFHQGRRPYPWSRVLYRVDQTGETLTLAELEEKSRRLADALRSEYDIMPKDVVGIFAKDRIQYPIAYFGALAAGATVALIPVQQEMSETDIATRLVQSQVKLLITDSDLLLLAEVSTNLAGAVRLITLDDSPNQLWASLERLLARGRPDADLFRLESEAGAEEYDAFLNRTSGSTGNVKSVLTSHAHFIATMEGTIGTIPDNTDPDHDVWLSPLSLGFFINAKLNMGLNILLGIPVVLMNGPLDETTVDVIGRHKVSFLFITPPIAARLARTDFQASGVDVSSVKWLLTAGAPMHENLRQTVSNQFGGVHLDLEWGTSETMLIAIQRDDDSRRSGYSGTLVNGMQAKVISTVTGQELGVGEAGEILVRNQLCRFKGYKDNEVANRDFDSEGWFHTGDYGHLDENCNVFIMDRIKELLKVGGGYGTHISAAELEAVVFEHPAVASVVVVGIRNDFTQLDEPTAFVILKPEYHQNPQLTHQLERDILHFANQKLTGLRKLTGGVRCLSHFPTTGFKINRRQLKQMGHAAGQDVANGLFPSSVPNYVQSV